MKKLTPPGLSNWLNEGKKWGYFEWLEDQIKNDFIAKIVAYSPLSFEATEEIVAMLKKFKSKI